MGDKILAIWLGWAVGSGSVHAKRLLEKYGSFREVYGLRESEYESVGIKRGSAVMERLLDKRLDAHEKSYSFCECNYFQIIEYTSAGYPQRLRAIKDPPPVIYARGRMIDFDDNVCIAIVGTRSYSDSGWNSTYKIASGIAAGGAVVVTGLASGIDTAATKAALESSGFAVGVLGSGVERIYPSENKELFEVMYRNGLVISEKAPFSEMSGRYFPVRNRLISGLCNGVLVGEGSVKSGAMITAGHASEQGRTIYAIPGDISGEESSGVNKLVREGAIPVFDASDVLDRYLYMYPHRIGKAPAAQSVDVPAERSTKRIRVVKGAASSAQAKSSVKAVESPAAKAAAGVPDEFPVIKPTVGVPKEVPAAKAAAVTAKEFPVIKPTVGVPKEVPAAKAAVKKKEKAASGHKKSKTDKLTGTCLIPGRQGELIKKLLVGEIKIPKGRIPKERYKSPVFRQVYIGNMEWLDERIEMHRREDEILSGLGDTEKKVFTLVCRKGSATVDSLCREMRLDAMEINIAVTALEVFGLVETSGPNVRKSDKY